MYVFCDPASKKGCFLSLIHILKITHAAYHLMAFGIIDDILRKSLEGLADIGDRHGENSCLLYTSLAKLLFRGGQ